MIRITLFLATLHVSASLTMASSLFILVKTDNQPEPVQLMSMDRDNVEILVPGEGHEDIPRDECLALLRPEPLESPEFMSWIRLRDGQVFIGNPARSSSSTTIHWNHPWIGTLEIPLDQVDKVRLEAPPPVGPDEGYDRVVLGNGDTLRGFITGVGEDVEMELERSTGTETTRIPWNRIASLDFFGDPLSSPGPRAWFMDGTVASFEELNLGRDSRFTFSRHPLVIESETREPPPQSAREVHSIVIGGDMFHPLMADSPGNPQVDSPVTRPFTPNPRATDPTAVRGLSPIELSGPITCSWSIPDGASRFRTRVLLPSSMQAWGNLGIELYVDGELLEQAHLSASHPMVPVDIPASGSLMVIKLTEGANGPVQDTVLLEYPMFLISP